MTIPEPLAGEAIALARAAEGVTVSMPLDAAVQRLLTLLRLNVGMDVAWVSEFHDGWQILRAVDAEPGVPSPRPGDRTPLSGAYCSRVLTGRLPPVIPDTAADPVAVLLPATGELHIGSYLGVPLHGPDGSPSGMLCLVGHGPVAALGDRDLASARLIAESIDALYGRAAGVTERRRLHLRLRERVAALARGDGRSLALQPILDLRTGEVAAVEALARFADTTRDPAQWFAAASVTGLRAELERRCVAAALQAAPPDGTPVAVNVSPQLVADGVLDEVLDGYDVSAVVVELTEHAAVASYPALLAALAPHRARGLRVAVDDMGAGYASLHHVLQVRPDWVKVDETLVRGVHRDPVRRAMLVALQGFSADVGALVVAEGVEDPGELAALIDIGVPLAQGFLLGEPQLAG